MIHPTLRNLINLFYSQHRWYLSIAVPFVREPSKGSSCYLPKYIPLEQLIAITRDNGNGNRGEMSEIFLSRNINIKLTR